MTGFKPCEDHEDGTGIEDHEDGTGIAAEGKRRDAIDAEFEMRALQRCVSAFQEVSPKAHDRMLDYLRARFEPAKGRGR